MCSFFYIHTMNPNKLLYIFIPIFFSCTSKKETPSPTRENITTNKTSKDKTPPPKVQSPTINEKPPKTTVKTTESDHPSVSPSLPTETPKVNREVMEGSNTKIITAKNNLPSKKFKLHYAAENGDIAAFQNLTEEDKEMLDTLDEQGKSILHRVIGSQHENSLKIIHLLNKAGMNMNIKDKNQTPAFQQALILLREDIIHYFLDETDVDVTMVGPQQSTALHLATKLPLPTSILQKIVNKVPKEQLEAYINKKDHKKNTGLHYLARYDSQQDHESEGMSHYTYDDSKLRAVEILLEAGAEVNPQNAHKRTPMDNLRHYHTQMMGLLKSKGGAFNIPRKSREKSKKKLTKFQQLVLAFKTWKARLR